MDRIDQCPVCGGTPVLCQTISSLAEGTDCYSLCCGIGQDIIDNWDVLEALPEIHQQMAIEQSRQQRAEYAKRIADALANFTAAKPLPEELRLTKGGTHATERS